MVADARARMIDSAAVLLARHGSRGASFSEVLAASGAPRGSLYHHFPGGKEELVLAALDAAGARADGVLDGLVGRDAVAVTEAFLGLWRRLLVATDLAVGCAVAGVTVDAESPVLIERSAAVFRGWRGRLATLLEAGGVPSARSAALAATVIAASEGAVLLARAERDLAVFDLVADETIAAVRAALSIGV